MHEFIDQHQASILKGFYHQNTNSIFIFSSWGKADCYFNVSQWCTIECSSPPSGNVGKLGKKLGIPHAWFFLLDRLILYHFSVFHKLIVFAVSLVFQVFIWIYGSCSMWPFYFSIISVNNCKSPFLLLKMANVTKVLLSFLFFLLVSDS